MNKQAKVLIVVTNHNAIDANHPTGLWLEEFATPYQLFSAAEIALTVASPQGGRVPVDPRSEPTAEQAAAWAEPIARLQNTLPTSAVKASDYDAIFMPGGHGTMFDLPGDAGLQRLLTDFAEQDKPIAAVCHGPAALTTARLADGSYLIAGKRMTGFTNEEERAAELDTLMPFLLESKLREAGGQFVAAAMWSDHVEQDGKLITGQNPQSSASVAQAIILELS